MRKILSKPKEVGVVPPTHVNPDMFDDGFQHSINGGQLSERDHFRMSFREGFRAGRLYLKELRKKQGVIDFPLKAKVKIKAITPNPSK